MNFQHCLYVQTIARTGSFSAAAKELYLTQPNLSAAVKNLEEELGVSLFHRSHRGATLTEDGQDFLRYAKRILGEVHLLENRYKSQMKRSFTLATHHYDFLSVPLAEISQSYKASYQEFQMIETTTRKIIESVADFESDLGIIYINADNRHLIEQKLQAYQLDFIPLGDFPTRIFLGKHHPLAQEKTLKQSQLEGYTQVRFRQDSDSMLFDEDPSPIHPDQQIIYSNDRGTVFNLLCQTDAYASGLGILSGFSKDKISLIPMEDSLQHTLGIVCHQQRQASAIIKDFIAAVREHLAAI